MSVRLSQLQAAEVVLARGGPLAAKDITAAMIAQGLWIPRGEGKTSTAGLSIKLQRSAKSNDGVFIKVRPGVYGLRGIHVPAPALPPRPEGNDPAALAAWAEQIKNLVGGDSA